MTIPVRTAFLPAMRNQKQLLQNILMRFQRQTKPNGYLLALTQSFRDLCDLFGFDIGYVGIDAANGRFKAGVSLCLQGVPSRQCQITLEKLFASMTYPVIQRKVASTVVQDNDKYLRMLIPFLKSQSCPYEAKRQRRSKKSSIAFGDLK